MSLYLPAQAHDPPEGAVRDDGALASVRRQLEQYFAGGRQTFELPLAVHGTSFRQRVWEELQGVAYGETISYGELAARSGRPGAARAAGSANGANPISIVIPCHRVIGSNGALTGYGGGLEAKRYLLALERSRG
ncbi:MAG: methylated-DNA-[protein]-cysteine S-methyltransferase [Gaiellales bacterium]|nr:methylated-DNA-[protein]-cysteine S-methyltransferase [Gaiellales bacterium]